MSHRQSLRKGDFRAGQQADRHARSLDVRKATSPGAEIARNELIANRGGSRADVLQAVVTHIRYPFWKVTCSKRAQASDCSDGRNPRRRGGCTALIGFLFVSRRFVMVLKEVAGHSLR